MNVYPVIHYSSLTQTMENCEIAFSEGCHGIFLINMGFPQMDAIIPTILESIREKYPDKKIGVNMLWTDIVAAISTTRHVVDMLWTDNLITNLESEKIKSLNLENFEIFESFAFKYKKEDPDFVNTGHKILKNSRVPTTSGECTGEPPPIEKLEALKGLTRLALASGLSPDNIHIYKPYITDAVVATGISETFYKFDREKVRDFVRLAN